MTAPVWFLAGAAIIPLGFAIFMVADTVTTRFRHWYTKRVDISAKTLAWRRSLIVGLTLELLDATHVRAIRLPFNRLFVIRSNPRMQYDFVGKSWVVIGDDYKNAHEVFGEALDKLGYAIHD